MDLTITQKLTSKQFEQINLLWNKEYPIKLMDRFPILLEGIDQFAHYLIEDDDKNILAWAVIFFKENENRFSIIVDSKYKRKGLGKELIERLKNDYEEFYGWVIDHNNDIKLNGKYYQTPLSFYQKQGFEILKDTIIDTEMIKAVKVKWLK